MNAFMLESKIRLQRWQIIQSRGQFSPAKSWFNPKHILSKFHALYVKNSQNDQGLIYTREYGTLSETVSEYSSTVPDVRSGD